MYKEGRAMAEQKTNVMRVLEQKKIVYHTHTYPHGNDAVDGITVASLIGKAEECVFKTLVARGASKNVYVFVIPVCSELDLKKGAKASHEKSVEMVHVSDINSLTGYVRGGCSPIGMKKQYKTYLDSSCLECESIVVSAGKIGAQVELSPQDLIKLTRAETALLTKEP